MKCPPLAPRRACKKNKMSAAVHINGCRNNSDNPALRSPLLSARTPGPVPSSAPYMTSANPTVLDSEREFLLPLSRDCVLFLCVSHSCLTSFTDVAMHRSSPQALRRDIGLAITHRSVSFLFIRHFMWLLGNEENIHNVF